jgi:outer membrane receptor protein involved in Fe transport
MRIDRWHSCFKLSLYLGAALFPPISVEAAPPAAIHYDLPSQALADALHQVARRSGAQIMFSPDQVAGLSASGLIGDFDAQEAVARLIAGTGLVAEQSDGTIVIRGRSAPPRAAVAGAAEAQSDIVVTGSRIRGAETTSPMLAASREAIEGSGFSDLGSYVRALPQNFSGGQNPGVAGGGDQGGHQNITSSSTLNLRGLGSDATLTLVNGHRVAYDGANQGVDIAAIPLAAIDRIEIVPDGSSALYGSDAVGGVANVILRRDFQGLETSARFGASTDGGNEQQQYDAVTGRRWSAGGFMLAGDYSRSTQVSARQRSYTQSLDDSATLLPRQQQYSIVLAGHQQVTERITLSIDGQFNHRTSFIGLPFTSGASYLVSGSASYPSVRSYSISPSLKWKLADDWTATLTGTHGNSRVRTAGCVYSGGIASRCGPTTYNDSLDTMEAGAEGPVFSLPGGDLRLAFGGGFRSAGLDTRVVTTSGGATQVTTDYSHSRHIGFAYGEVSLPLVGGVNTLPLIRELRFSGAARYENYKGIGDIVTPKLGLIYAPISDITLKASWGRSFKAPTLNQQYQIRQGLLFPSSFFGANQPAAQTTILLGGGNPDLKPEKAETWTVTAIAQPKAITGLTLEASYFHIRYRNRVVEPIVSINGLLNNPVYRDLIVFDPSLDQVAAAVTGLPEGLRNFTGAAFDPAVVGAIADDSLQNTASQSIHGIDMRADYQFKLAGGDSIDLNGSASYLASHEKLSPDQPSIALAGTIFNPPHWRARAGGLWARGDFSLSAFVNYIGGTLDNRLQPYVRVGSMTSFDLSAQITPSIDRGAFKDIKVLLSCLNLSNAKPAVIRNSNVYDPTYDSTNYSAAGRVVSLTLTRKW